MFVIDRQQIENPLTKAVGDVLGIRKGDTIGFFLRNGEVVIKKVEAPIDVF